MIDHIKKSYIALWGLVLGLLLLTSCGQTSPVEAEDRGPAPATSPLALAKSQPQKEAGQLVYVEDMLEALEEDLEEDQPLAADYFLEDCQKKMLGDDTYSQADARFWQAYLNNLSALYIEADIEMTSVELNGQGDKGQVTFLLEMEGDRSADDLYRNVRADLLMIDGNWRFSRYEERDIKP